MYVFLLVLPPPPTWCYCRWFPSHSSPIPASLPPLVLRSQFFHHQWFPSPSRPTAPGPVVSFFHRSYCLPRPRGLTVTWWGCYGLYLWHKPTELARSFLFCSSICLSLLALSTVFHSINSSDYSPLSHSVLLVLFLPYWSFQLFISWRKSPSALM